MPYHFPAGSRVRVRPGTWIEINTAVIPCLPGLNLYGGICLYPPRVCGGCRVRPCAMARELKRNRRRTRQPRSGRSLASCSAWRRASPYSGGRSFIISLVRVPQGRRGHGVGFSVMEMLRSPTPVKLSTLERYGRRSPSVSASVSSLPFLPVYFQSRM